MTVRDLASPLSRLLAARLTFRAEFAIYLAFIVAALVLRFWDLGERAYHHDESIHAKWSWDLLKGTYAHSPVFHGPFYYHVQALTFFVTGASDYTARISAALFGIALVTSPLLIRRYLGQVGTIAAVGFIALSPTLVYFSRFLREDIYVAFFTLLMIIAVVRYLDEGRLRWLALLGGAFTGAVLTKEGAFITTGVFLLFLDVLFAANLGTATAERRANRAGREQSDQLRGQTRLGSHSPNRVVPGRVRMRLSSAAWAVVIAPVAWIIAGLWPFLAGLRAKAGWPAALPRSGETLLLLGTFCLPLLTPGARTYLLEPLGVVETDRLNWQLSLSSNPSDGDLRTLAGLFAITTGVAAFAGLNWRPRFWAALFAACALTYLTLMTSFWTNIEGGLVSGPWGSLDYWISQQDEHRGDQPWFYYYMVIPAYEFLPLLIAAAGSWWAVVRGNTFSRLLVFWVVGQWLALSFASEKMPWNATHITVPLCLLAAWTVQRAWNAWRGRGPPGAVALTVGGITWISAGTMVVVAWAPDPLSGELARLAILAAGIATVCYISRALGRQALPTVMVAAVVGGLAIFSVRTMIGVSFVRADNPRDLLIYTQSSGELAAISRDINLLADISGKNKDLKIAVDSTDSFGWPWAWYLRDYNKVSFPNLRDPNTSLAEFDVILVNASNLNSVNEVLGNTSGELFADPDRYPHRWWFDEVYKAAMNTGSGACLTKSGDCGPFNPDTWKVIGENIFDGSWPKIWLRFIRDHDPEKPNGSVDAYVLFPATFDRDAGVLLPAADIIPIGPSTDDSGRLTFGSWGTAPGQFLEPIDIAGDSDGNIFVIDRASHRLQKFDSSGNFIAGIDVEELADDNSNSSDPWGITVGPQGEVVVADTFGHRIRIYDGDLNPLTSFGEPPSQSETPGKFELFGPRDAIFDADGNIWVTDTGHDRIMVFTPDGEFLRQVGGPGSAPGEFDEPVGLAIDSDGTVFVADMWNSRVQLLDATGEPIGEFGVSGWGGFDAADKPYLAALPDGRVAVGLPLLNEVRIYERDGTLYWTFTPWQEGLDRPYGLLPLTDGRLWIAEGGSRRVRLFEIP